MVHIIDPGERRERRPFLGVASNRNALRTAYRIFHDTVEQSFAEDQRHHGEFFVTKTRTKHEEKRRLRICFRWFEVMRRDYSFSLQRIADELPRALRTELNGGTYSPPERQTLWAPEGDLR